MKQNPDRYKMIKVNGEWRPEHRVIWEEHNGPVPEGMVIHHIDGTKINNNIENLQMMTPSDHVSLHLAQSGRAVTTVEENSECTCPEPIEGTWPIACESCREYTRKKHNAKRQAKYRKKKKDSDYIFLQEWLHDDDRKKVMDLVEKLKQRREQ